MSAPICICASRSPSARSGSSWVRLGSAGSFTPLRFRSWSTGSDKRGLALFGGVLLGLAYLTLAVGGSAWLAPIAVTAIGLGFFALHNTLQTNATQMTPQARGTAVAIFSSAIYLGQTLGGAAGAVGFG